MSKEHHNNSYRDLIQALACFPTETRKLESFPKITLVFGPSDYFLEKTRQFLKDSWRIFHRNNPGDSSDEAALPSIVVHESQELAADRIAEVFGQDNLFDPATLHMVTRAERRAELAKWLQRLNGKVASRVHLAIFIGKDALTAEWGRFAQMFGAHIVPCFEPQAGELMPYLCGLGQRYGILLHQDSARMMVELLGTDLIVLDNEIKRLSLVFADRPKGRELGFQELAPFLGALREDHSFALDGHILDGEWSKALALTSDLLRRGETPLALLGLLSRHCRNAIYIKDAVSQGASSSALGGKLRLPTAVLRKYSNYTRKQSLKNLKAGLARCVAADQAIKSTSVSDHNLLANVILALAGS